MSKLINALDRIINWFQSNKPSIINSLQPGLTIKEIEDKVKDLPFRLTQEVYELYQWRNGTIDDGNDFFSYYRFLPLKEASEVSKNVSESWGLSLPFGWFPLFEYEGEVFAVVGAEENTENSIVLKTYEGIDIAHRSLTNMMCCIAECYEKGAYYIDELGNLEENRIAAKNILLKYNPEYHSILEARTETVNNPDGSQVISKYHPDSDILLANDTIDRKGNIIELSEFFKGKKINCRTYNKEIEGFYDYMCEENWFNDYEKYEIFTVESQYKYVAPKIERKYINGVLKEEIIHPDEKPDNFLWIFTLFFGIFQLIISIVFFIFNSLTTNQRKQQ